MRSHRSAVRFDRSAVKRAPHCGEKGQQGGRTRPHCGELCTKTPPQCATALRCGHLVANGHLVGRIFLRHGALLATHVPRASSAHHLAAHSHAVVTADPITVVNFARQLSFRLTAGKVAYAACEVCCVTAYR